MPLKTLMAGAAMLALCAGAAHAATHKTGGTYAEPSQPVAYAKLGAYLKASPSQKAKGDWGLDASQTAAATAPTGSAVNASAMAPANPPSATPSSPDASSTTPMPAAPDTTPTPASPAPDTATPAPAAGSTPQ